MSASICEGKTRIVVVGGKASGECAVAVINEREEVHGWTDDYDPIYLTKQHGRWVLLPTFTRFDSLFFRWDGGQLAAYTSLDEWFENEERRLTKRDRQ